MASTPTGDPFTYMEAMECHQPHHSIKAMEEDSTLTLLNNTLSALNFQEVFQLQHAQA